MPKKKPKISKDVILDALKKAASTYDRMPQEGLRMDKLEVIADELIKKL